MEIQATKKLTWVGGTKPGKKEEEEMKLINFYLSLVL